MAALDLPDTDLLHEPRLITESGVAQRVAALVSPVLADLGFRLIRAKVSGAYGSTLQVMAERPDGTISIEDCEVISHAISPILDLEDVIAAAYRLEISSPGVDRPLVRRSDFERAVGHEAKIELSRTIENRRRYRGEIAAVADRDGTVFLTLAFRDAAAGEPATAEIDTGDIQDARLVLSDALLRQSLRQEKTKLRPSKAHRPKSGAAHGVLPVNSQNHTGGRRGG